jgi:hypothetical protein
MDLASRLPSGHGWGVLPFEGGDELGGLGGPAELVLEDAQGGLVAHVGHAGLGRAVGQQEAGVVAPGRLR